MASPKIETIFFYSITTGVPLTGLVPTFSAYKNDLGTNITQPIITEIGGGAYYFTPVFADPARAIFYILDGGATSNPRYAARLMRPEDWNDDAIPAIQTTVNATATDVAILKSYEQGRWKVVTTGPDANRLVLYSPIDNVTPLIKFDLKDNTGAPTSLNPFERYPV